MRRFDPPDPGTVGDEDRGPLICRSCGGDCEDGDYCEQARRYICVRCWAMDDDRRHSTPDDYSGEAA